MRKTEPTTQLPRQVIEQSRVIRAVLQGRRSRTYTRWVRYMAALETIGIAKVLVRLPGSTLTEADVRAIRASKLTTRQIAAEWGRPETTIYDIRARNSFKNIA